MQLLKPCFLCCLFLTFCFASISDQSKVFSASDLEPVPRLPNTRSYSFRLDSFPFEVNHQIFSYLTLEMVYFGSACHSLRDELEANFKRLIKLSFPSLSFSGARFLHLSLFFFYHLDTFRKEFAQSCKESITFEDLGSICYFKGFSINDFRSTKASAIIGKSLGWWMSYADNNIDFTTEISMESIFKRSLYFTAEYLLQLGKISTWAYYSHASRFANSELKRRFLLKVATFPDPELILGEIFDADFAILLLESADAAARERILQMAARKLNTSSRVSSALVHELTTRRDLLQIISEDKDLDPAWLSCFLLTLTEENLQTLKTDGSWRWKKYLLLLEAFDVPEFEAFAAPHLEVLKFLPSMNLNRSCHFKLFAHLIKDGRTDLTDVTRPDSKLIRVLARSKIPWYLNLLFKRQPTLPSIKAIKNNFGCYLIDSRRLAALAKYFKADDFLLFDCKASWKFLAPHFDALEISDVTASVAELLKEKVPVLNQLPQEVVAHTQWPLLHLSVLYNNCPAFKRILKHPRFKVEATHEAVAGLDLVQFIKAVEGAYQRGYNLSHPFSEDFLAALEKFESSSTSGLDFYKKDELI